MKRLLFFLLIPLVVVSCSDGREDEKVESKSNGPIQNSSVAPSSEVSFEIELDELFGDWVLIGVGIDSIGPGTAPYGEIFFAFRDSGNMTIATEGVQELQLNLNEIPSPFQLNGNSICSNDLLFKMQFNEPCAEIIRLNQGRMSIAIELEGGGKMYKHFVKVE